MATLLKLLRAIPAQYRKISYVLLTIAVIVITAIQVWYTAIPDAGAAPDWTFRALAVCGYVGGALGLAAAVNVNRVGPPPNPGEGLDLSQRGATDTRTVALIALAVAVVALLLVLFNVRVVA